MDILQLHFSGGQKREATYRLLVVHLQADDVRELKALLTLRAQLPPFLPSLVTLFETQFPPL